MRSLITILLLGFFISSEAQNISQSQVRQFNAVPAYRVFGRGSGVGSPSFIQLDSNHIPLLHSQGYYDGRFQPLGSYLTGGSIAWPALFSSPTTGTITSGSLGFSPTLSNQTANTFFAAPSSGSAASPTFRSLVAADFPNLTIPIGSINATGTPSATTYLRGDGSWGTPSGGGSVGISGSSFLGTIYNQNTYTGTTDFTQVGASTLTVTGNKIVVTGGTAKTISATVGTSNTTLPNVLRITAANATVLEKYKFSGKFKINATPSTTTNGFGIGTYSINSSAISNCIAYFNASTNTGTGTISLLIGTTNNTAAISSTTIPFALNDYINITIEREGDRVTAIAKNITASGQPQASCSYSWDFSNVSNFLAPNTSNFAVANMAGTGNSFIIDSLNITSRETKNAPLILVGDSKFQGYSTSFDTRIASLLDRKYLPGTIVEAGQGDRTADVLARIAEIIALAPRQVILLIGRNDIGTGVSAATWQANIASIVSQLQTAGISVIISDGLYETNANQSTYATYIQSTYPNNYIPTLAAGSAAGYLSSDNTHPNFAGSQLYADLFYNSPLVGDSSKYLNGKPLSTSLNFSANGLTYGSNIRYQSLANVPDVVNAGDIIMPPAAALVSSANLASQKTRLLVNGGDGNMYFATYTTGTAQETFQFSSAGAGATGTNTKVMSITGDGRLRVKGGANTVNSVAGDVQLQNGSGISGGTSTNVGQEGRIVPLTAGYFTELRNYKSIGQIVNYVSGGTDGTQLAATTIQPDGNVGINQTANIPSSALTVTSTTKGIMIPRMTTAQRDAIGVGIATISIGAGGSGYTTSSSYYLTSTGGGGAGAIISAVVTGGAVTGVTVVSAGSGYTSSPTFSMPSGSGGTGATFTSTLTTQTLVEGTEIYNLTLHQKQYYNGTTWVSY